MGMFANKIEYTQYEDRLVISAADLFVSFFEDNYFLWERRVLNKEYAKIYYKDITSVSYSNGGSWSDAYLSVSTAGKTFYAKMVGEFPDMHLIAETIENGRTMFAQQPQQVAVNTYSEADEILKFKNLLDQGIITEEEFNAKKKQLLGL